MSPPVHLLPPSTLYPSYLIYAIRTKGNAYMLGQYHSSLWTETCLDTSRSQSMHHTLKGSDSQPFCSMGEYFGGASCKPRDWMALIILTNICLT